MQSRTSERIRELLQPVHDNPALKKIIEEDPKAEMNPLIHNHIMRVFQHPAELL